MKDKDNILNELETIAKHNGLWYEVSNTATRLMESGVDEVDAYQFACVEWDVL